MDTLDITPTWRGVLPVLLFALSNGTAIGKKMAMDELTRMASLADELVALDKAKAPSKVG